MEPFLDTFFAEMKGQKGFLCSQVPPSGARKRNNEAFETVSLSLSEDVSQVMQNVHDEIAEVGRLDFSWWVCESSFDGPSELSITVLQEISMSMGFGGEYDRYYKTYEIKSDWIRQEELKCGP